MLTEAVKEELIVLQASLIKQKCFEVNCYVKFFFNEGQLPASYLTRISMETAIFPFTTSYKEETTFSTLALTKTKNRNRLIIYNDI